MIKVLLDINVILDVLQKREPYYQNAAEVLSLCADGQIKGYISAISFGTLHYVLSKHIGNKNALTSLTKMRAFSSVASVNQGAIDLALAAGFSDFEDAIQYYCAVENRVDQIITRNKKDFSKAKLTVLTSTEFLRTYSSL